MERIGEISLVHGVRVLLVLFVIFCPVSLVITPAATIKKHAVTACFQRHKRQQISPSPTSYISSYLLQSGIQRVAFMLCVTHQAGYVRTRDSVDLAARRYRL